MSILRVSSMFSQTVIFPMLVFMEKLALRIFKNFMSSILLVFSVWVLGLGTLRKPISSLRLK